MKLLLLGIILITGYAANCKKTEDNSKYYGTYSAYKWLDLPVTEMADEDANDYLTKSLLIGKDKMILFNDTFNNVVYKLSKYKSIEYFREFRHFDYVKIARPNDEITVLTAETSPKILRPPKDIIILPNAIVMEYKGYFFFFRKSKGEK